MAIAAAGSGSCSFAIPCLCLLARVGIPLLLFLCSRVCGLRARLVAVVCSLAACGSLPSVSRGFPSYHHFFPRGLPTRYALIPSLFRSAVLVASCSLAVSTFSSAVAAYRVCMFGKGERVAVSLVAGRVGVACVSIRGGPCCVHPYLLLFAAAYMCAGIPLALLVPLGACGTCVLWRRCALRCCVVPSIWLHTGVPHTMLLSCVRTAQSVESIECVREWLGGGLVLVAVVRSLVGTSPCLYLVVRAAAPTACACMDIPHGLASAGTFACVSWCGVPFFIFPCGALRFGGLFPLSLSHTLLVPWLPCPMRAGDSSGCALLLVVAWRLCPLPRVLTSAPFSRVAAWRVV